MRDLRRVLVVVVALLAAGLVGAEASVAGTYVIRNCVVPGHAPAPLGPWRSTPGPNVTMVDGCASGGGFTFALPETRNMPNPSSASLDLALPEDRSVAVERVRVWATARRGGPVGLLRGVVNVVQNAVPADVAELPDGVEAVTETPIPRATRTVQLALICGESDRPPPARAGALVDCVADEAVPLKIHGIETTLREDIAPTAAAVGGTLLVDTPVSAERSLDYSASDHESGLTRIEAVLGETVVAVRDLGSRCSGVDLAVCPTMDRNSLVVDTRKVANGRHAVTLRAFDAAGNRADVALPPVDVQQNLPGSGAPLGLGLVAGVQLSAGFGGSLRSTLIVPFGRRVAVSGRLTSASGSGVGKAQVDVFERLTQAAAQEVASGQAHTRADGSFTYQLAPRRPSRTIRLAYGSIASSRLLNVRVRAAATLSATLRGTLVRFSGRVLSRPLPRGGKLVRLEGRAPGFAWTKFATLRSDRLGRFAGRYRLRARRPGVRVQIRVGVPAERRYPYLTFTGRPVTLRVR